MLRSRSCVFVFTMSTVGGMKLELFDVKVVDVVLIGGCLITDLNVVEGAMISSIDDILADNRSAVNSLLLCNIFFSRCRRCSSLASDDFDCTEYFDLLEDDAAKLLVSDVTTLLTSGISPLAFVANEISDGIAIKSNTISECSTIFVLPNLFVICRRGSRKSSSC